MQELLRALTHDDHMERHHAAAALGRSGDPGAVPALMTLVETEGRGHWLPWVTAIQALAALGDLRASPALVASLKASNRTVRLDAVLALEQIGDEDAIEPLRALAHDPAEQEYLKRHAARAIAALGGEPVPPGLEIDITTVWARRRALAEAQARFDAELDQALAQEVTFTDPVDKLADAAASIATAADSIADHLDQMLDA